MKITVRGPLVECSEIIGKKPEYKAVVHTRRIMSDCNGDLVIEASDTDSKQHFVNVSVHLKQKQYREKTQEIIKIPVRNHEEVVELLDTLHRVREETLNADKTRFTTVSAKAKDL